MKQLNRTYSFLRAAIISLTFGVVGTVVIAVGCAVVWRPHTMPSLSSHSKYLISGDLWAGMRSTRPGAHHFLFYRPDSVFNSKEATPGVLEAPAWVAASHDKRPRVSWARLGCGWPQVCFVAGRDCLSTPGNPMPPPIDWGYVTLGKTSRRSPGDVQLYFDDKIPIRPNWFGLLWNIAFYAFAWLIAASIVSWFVQRKRARAKRCVNCGYSLSGLAAGAPCPECGYLTSPQSPSPSQQPSEPRV